MKPIRKLRKKLLTEPMQFILKGFQISEHAPFKMCYQISTVECINFHDMSRDMKFPIMRYMQPAKPQISLRIRAV